MALTEVFNMGLWLYVAPIFHISKILQEGLIWDSPSGQQICSRQYILSFFLLLNVFLNRAQNFVAGFSLGINSLLLKSSIFVTLLNRNIFIFMMPT